MNVEPGRLVRVEAETFDVRERGTMWYGRAEKPEVAMEGQRGQRESS